MHNALNLKPYISAGDAARSSESKHCFELKIRVAPAAALYALKHDMSARTARNLLPCDVIFTHA